MKLETCDFIHLHIYARHDTIDLHLEPIILYKESFEPYEPT